MHRNVSRFQRTCLALALLVSSSAALAASAWIDDKVLVPVRSGAGTEYRILHKGLPSGTTVDVVEAGSDWTKIRFGDIEGFVSTRYLSNSPTAAIQLERLQAQHEKLKTQLNEAREQLKTIGAERDTLSEQNASLNNNLSSASDRLGHLEEVAANPIRLDQANRKLNEEMSVLRTELEATKAENERLERDRTTSWFVAGGILVIISFLAGMLMSKRNKRGRGGWA